MEKKIREKILITAFEPFGGKRENASCRVLRELPERIGGFDVRRMVLPVVFGKAAETAETEGCAAVFLLGEAGRDRVTPETTARNRRDARIQDNEGNQPKDEAILSGGPEEYHTAVSAGTIVRRMQEEGYPIALSDDAGAFVCNDTFYLVGTGNTVPVEFIHVPAEMTDRTTDTVHRFIELAMTEYRALS